ncbi:MAG: hypothetical protein NC293_09780 [Roseburia sp.]|nr:hypothetical protein [Roseburia sp.]
MSTKNAVVPETDTTPKTETKTEAKTAKKAPVKGAETKKEKEPVIYLGPNIKGIANHCEVFSGGAGSFFDKRAETVPVLKNLLFPISKGGEKLAELKNGGTVARLYQAAKDQLEKGEADEQ